MESEAAAAQRALEAVWTRLYAELDGARFERRGDLLFALYPPVPIPQWNGAWVVDDTQAAADALSDAIDEVDASGAWPWVQTRSGQDKTQSAAAKLGLTERDSLPGMVVRPDELSVPPGRGLAIDRVAAEEVGSANTVLAAAFGVPIEMLDAYAASYAMLEEASCYVARVGDEVVATALGITVDGATGIFNVATMPEHRGRGYGAAVTAGAVRDGFAGRARLAFLQSSRLGHNVYRRLGFRDVAEYVLLTRPGVEIR